MTNQPPDFNTPATIHWQDAAQARAMMDQAYPVYRLLQEIEAMQSATAKGQFHSAAAHAGNVIGRHEAALEHIAPHRLQPCADWIKKTEPTLAKTGPIPNALILASDLLIRRTRLERTRRQSPA